MVTVELNVVLAPEQTVFDEVLILIVAEAGEVAVIVIEFEETTVVVTHVALEVMIQFTTSPLFNEDDVYVVLFVPTFVPFTFH